MNQGGQTTVALIRGTIHSDTLKPPQQATFQFSWFTLKSAIVWIYDQVLDLFLNWLVFQRQLTDMCNVSFYVTFKGALETVRNCRCKIMPKQIKPYTERAKNTWTTLYQEINIFLHIDT